MESISRKEKISKLLLAGVVVTGCSIPAATFSSVLIPEVGVEKAYTEKQNI